MTATNSNFYQVGASLPVDAPSYVKRQADEVFYQKLRDGKFCYVLNSRQMGKSSLRVQTMQRLQKEGTVCAAIDLTGIGKVSQQQWYGGIVYNLSESCQLEDKFDFDWQEWWGKHQTVLSPVQCLGLFIEKVLLDKIQQPIVIFVDEIDKVLSQDFSTDDFFGLIRFFQNQRVDNPIFQRLTFALLGVATPGDLIQNKTQTPFNIGEAIELHGFQINEVEPLIEGLRERFDNPQGVIKSILDWTGGQPFLTQKLCKFMVEESEKDNPGSVKEVVKSRIIENWESQDDPEHLRTIRDRILSSEQRAGYLLELYQQIQQKGEVAAKKNVESSELRLSGLVVQREGKLRVYNRVYQRIFNKNWVEVQLNNLRPYSEAFRAWVASGGTDESLLLRGNALSGAERWAKGKDLSFQDKQFLAASREKEIQEKIAVEKREAQLERERKDKEAAEQRNLVLSEANRKAKLLIRNGTVVLVVTLILGVISGTLAGKEVVKAKIEIDKTNKEIKNVSLLSSIGSELYKNNKRIAAEKAWKQASISLEIRNSRLKQAMLLNNTAIAYQELGKLNKANKVVWESFKLLQTDVEKKNSSDQLILLAQAFQIKGDLLKVKGDIQEASSAYTKALDTFQSFGNDLTSINPAIQISLSEIVEGVYKGKISTLFTQSRENTLSQQNLEKVRHLTEFINLAQLYDYRQIVFKDTDVLKINQIDSKAAVIYPILLKDSLEIILHLPGKNLLHKSISEPKAKVKNNVNRLYKSALVRDDETYLKKSQQIYNWLIKPIESELKTSRVKTLVFVTDRVLRNVPMSSLHDGKRFLVEKYAIAFTPGVQMLEPQPYARRPLKAVAAGVVGGSKNEKFSFEPFPHAKQEIANISKMIPSNVLLDEAFTTEALKKAINLSSISIVHFATPGNFSSKPEENFILAGNRHINVKELYEIFKSRKQNQKEPLELVVFSSCRGATGDENVSFGFAGIPIRMGARSSLASLWKVSDKPSAILMEEFYSQLTTGKVTKAEALRLAQLKMLNSEYPPNYWTNYVLVGNWL